MTDEELMSKVYDNCMSYVAQREVPLPLTTTKQGLRAALLHMVGQVRLINPSTLLPDGEVKSALPELYQWKLFASVVREIDLENEAAITALEAIMRGETPESEPMA